MGLLLEVLRGESLTGVYRIAVSQKPRAGEHLEEQGVSNGAHADMKRNLEAKIKNPLEGIPREQLMADVSNFVERHNLQDYHDLFRKGALVAQDPPNAVNIDGAERLTEEELNVLEREVTHKWDMPKKLFLTIATCSIGAAVQGWDQTGSNGANLWMPAYYGLDQETTEGTLLLGLLNAGPYLGSALIGCWLSDPINNYFGRRGVIFFSAHFCIWPVIGSAFCETWGQQMACRLLMGIGMGVKASTVPIYAAENSPASIRGALVMSWQMWTAFGIMLGTAFNLAVYRVATINWRLMLGAPFLPAVPLLVMIYMCPESPRWYMKKGRYLDAWKSMVQLRHHPLQVARDMYYISSQLEIENELMGKSNYVTRFVQLFTIPRVRRANLAAFTVMIAQQLCGINIIAFYSTTIFSQSGLDDFKAMIGSFGFGLVNWLFAFPAFWTIDTFGRRSLLLFTFPQMFWTLLAAGLCTLIPMDAGDVRTGLVCLFVFLFGAFYSPGEGPVPFTYSAEVYPLSHRETGMSFAVATCLFWAAVLGTSFPFILKSFQTVGAFGLYAGFNVLAFFMILLWVPETMQRTLEELDWVFAVPTTKFMRYQVFTAVPWWFKRYVFFQRNAVKEPLYSFEAVAATANKGVGQKRTSSAGDHTPPSYDDEKKVSL
ncbi:putative polyol transporter 2 [Paramyrothecium foliicola]|nr:putative polyol transporter 2 [Paramyrothecium foliicola]